MAHTCPVCGATCMCNGDIDDICLDLYDDINACICCIDEDCDEVDYEEDNIEYPFDYPFDDEEGEKAEPSVKSDCLISTD